MKIISFIIPMLSLMLLLSQSVTAQQRTGPDEVLRIALENNQELKTARLNIQKENAITGKAFNIPRPQLFTEYEGVKGSLSNFESRKFGITQELEFPTNYFLRSDVQSSQILIAEEEYNVSVNHLKAELKTIYYNLLLQNKLLETAKDILKIYDDFYVVAQKKYDAGESSNLEVLGAKLNRIKIENQIKNTESEIRSLQSELKKLMNVTYDIETSEETGFKEYTFSKTNLLTRAMSDNPSMKIIRYRKDKFSNQLSLSRGELLPNISLSYYRQKIGNDNGFYGVELALGIPVWFWGEQSANIKGADYDLQIASSEEVSLRRSLENELNRSFEEYENSMRQLKFFRDEAVSESDEVFRQSKISYEEGAIGYVEYLQALTIVYDVRTQYLTSIYNYNKSLINLEEIIAGEVK
ncbi:MAG: TolC family protein [bacterium]